MALPVNKRVLKILFILFVVAFCVYLVPRVAINFFDHPDDKFTVPTPGRRNPSNLRLRTVLVCKAGLSLLLTGPAQRHRNHHSCSRQCRKYAADWPLVSWLPERNFNVFMFDYRGFGKSKGTPSQAGLLDDTQSAINVVRHRSDVNPQRLVLFSGRVLAEYSCCYWSG